MPESDKRELYFILGRLNSESAAIQILAAEKAKTDPKTRALLKKFHALLDVRDVVELDN
jgi:hypothetical protein